MARPPRGLAVVLSEANHARLHAALTLACAAAALGRPVRLFFHGESAAALTTSRHWQGDATYRAAGLASVAELVENAIGLGAQVMACQTGLQMIGVAATSLAEGIETGGMVAFLADARDDELVMG
jgi:predicted peroxiredoxin